MIKKIIDIILSPWRRLQERRRFKKRMEDLKKRDPFIYK